jgi:hypothetical protein
MAKTASEKVKIWVLPRNAAFPEMDAKQNWFALVRAAFHFSSCLEMLFPISQRI